MQMQRLLRLKYAKKPVAKPCSRRVRSPSGAGSTRITSAPRSASITPQEGPITVWLNSSTVRSASGSMAMDVGSFIDLVGIDLVGIDLVGIDLAGRGSAPL